MKKYFFLSILFLFISICSAAQTAIPGKPLPVWQKGYLDLHHINTGRGNAAFYIFPDGTTMLFFFFFLDTSDPRTFSVRNSTIHPNNKKLPYEFIDNQFGREEVKNLIGRIDYGVYS